MPPRTSKMIEKAHLSHCWCIKALEEDVRVLKRQLAVRAAVVKRDAGDPLAHLAAQDRKFLRKRLGLKDG